MGFVLEYGRHPWKKKHIISENCIKLIDLQILKHNVEEILEGFESFEGDVEYRSHWISFLACVPACSNFVHNNYTAARPFCEYITEDSPLSILVNLYGITNACKVMLRPYQIEIYNCLQEFTQKVIKFKKNKNNKYKIDL